MGPLEVENGGGGDPSPGMGGVVAISLALAQASPLLAVPAAGRPPQGPQGAPWPCAAHGGPPRFVGHESYEPWPAQGAARPCPAPAARGGGWGPCRGWSSPPPHGVVRAHPAPVRPRGAAGGGGGRGPRLPARVAPPRAPCTSPTHAHLGVWGGGGVDGCRPGAAAAARRGRTSAGCCRHRWCASAGGCCRHRWCAPDARRRWRRGPGRRQRHRRGTKVYFSTAGVPCLWGAPAARGGTHRKKENQKKKIGGAGEGRRGWVRVRGAETLGGPPRPHIHPHAHTGRRCGGKSGHGRRPPAPRPLHPPTLPRRPRLPQVRPRGS